MAIVEWSNDAELGAVELKASGNVQGSTKNAEAAVYAGKGRFKVRLDVTVLDVASGDELYIVDVEANTVAAPATFKRVATLLTLGDKAATGRDADDAIDSYVALFENPEDYQVRLVTYLKGSTAGGITYSAKMFPLPRKE